MNIKQALKLRIGDRVVVPADGPGKSYVGTVVSVPPSQRIHTSGNGDKHIVVVVKGDCAEAVWSTDKLAKV